jgi:hypothetical protein
MLSYGSLLLEGPNISKNAYNNITCFGEKWRFKLHQFDGVGRLESISIWKILLRGLRSKYMTRVIAFVIVLVAIVLFMECMAKDYIERIGPYEVNFTLPDDITSNTTMSKDTGIGEGANFNWYDTYSIDLRKLGTNESWGRLLIIHYNRSIEEDLVNDVRGAIISKCSGNDRRNECYHFHYHLDNRTSLDGNLYLNHTAVLSFLKSLHVREAT